MVNDVKITFFSFPYTVPVNSELKGFIKPKLRIRDFKRIIDMIIP